VFVPFVIVIAIGTFILWLWLGTSFNIENPFQNALYATVSVLIIACPCALGLATPTAIVVGTGEAAKQGILFKDAKALEIANKIKYMVFDKTGTLTKGQPKVHNFIKTGTEKDLEALIISTEMNSTHPLAQAIVKHFSTDVSALIKVDTYNETAGYGIKASIGQKTVIIGSAKFALADKQKESLMPFSYIIDELYEKGLSVVFCSVNGKIEAILGIGDEVKDSAREVVKELKTMNVQSIMLTGDNEHSASFIGNSVGLDEVIAEVSPKEKSQKVTELQMRHTTSLVGFVGDGINDAPALAQADVGIAMGTGTDVALQSGSVVLVGGNIVKVPQILNISKKTLSVIRQNLIWAFGYNLICIPVAAGLLYPQFGILLSPAVAGAAMALSSVSVVLNSLRLKTLIK
jgi:Cu+-exporting ATPase